MEQPTKNFYLERIGREFCILVAQTDFASRYYQLCQRFPLRIHQAFSCTKKEMFEILSEIGQTPKWDARDKSYSFDFACGEWSVLRGFVLQHEAVEFSFLAQRSAEKAGTNYTVIARTVTELIDPAKVPNPHAPRPCCYSRGDLREVLHECFQLSNLLCSILEKIPKVVA